MIAPTTYPVVGIQVAATSYAEAAQWSLERAQLGDRAYAVAAANTHVLSHARHDEEFGEAISKFDLICPDGMPLIWSVNAQLEKEERLTDRVYGPTLMLEVFRASENQPRVSHFLLGGQQSTLDKLTEVMSEKFPGAKVVGSYSPPFGTWGEEEHEKMKTLIRESGATFVWVGLGCPKQEGWIGDHLESLPPAVYYGIGAAFAFHTGEVKQAPSIFQRFGMEWLFRLCAEPRRLWKRYFTYNFLFIYYTLKDHIRG